MRPTPIWIAEARVVLVHPDGQRVPGYIRVGQPYTLGGGDPATNFESHCPIEIDSLYPPGCPAIGAGTLSALITGLQSLIALPKPPTPKPVRAARLAEKLRPRAEATWLAEACGLPAMEAKAAGACSAVRLSICWIRLAAVALDGLLAKLFR